MVRYYYFVLMFLLVGCGGSGSFTTATGGDESIGGGILSTPKIAINEDKDVYNLGKSETINATISVGSTPKDLYLVLSNSVTSSSTTPSITINGQTLSRSILPVEKSTQKIVSNTAQYVRDFNSHSILAFKRADTSEPREKSLLATEPRYDVVGETQKFYMGYYDNSNYTVATAKKIVSNISTKYGNKTLNIWVSNDTFGNGCGKSYCITQEMMDKLALAFLQSGDDNDIYDWDTNIYGEEWGNDTKKADNLIASNNEITILLTDIDNDDSPNGGVMGYFFSKDNFLKSSYSGSNERIMFYIDSVMFANSTDGEAGWSIDDPMPKETVSTLAHEFQHMIHFYQKGVLQLPSGSGAYTDTWIDEMISETTEDIVATKIRHTGPRGVTYTDGSAGSAGNKLGRYPMFNENNNIPMTTWTHGVADYSKVSAFGTFLVRNYGGVELLRNIVHNPYTDKKAVEYAVKKTTGKEKTLDELLSEWGIAVMRSDIISDDFPTYNTGDFKASIYNGIEYDMGSINFFNYSPKPSISSSSSRIQAGANGYYKIGTHMTGDVKLDLQLNGDTEATLVVK